MQRQRARREHGDESPDRDGEDRERDQHLDDPEAVLLENARNALRPRRCRAHCSCCHVPGSGVTLAEEGPVVVVVVVDAAPGLVTGTAKVSLIAFAPLNVPVSAVTGPFITEPFAPLNAPFVYAMPS